MVAELILSREIDGHAIGQRQGDGFVNATALCKAAGKNWAGYWRLDSTRAFVAELEADMQIHTSALVQSRKGGSGFQGTWVHPRVATHLAQWCSPRFAALVSGWVLEILTTGRAGPPADSHRLESRLAQIEAMIAAIRVPASLAAFTGPAWTIDMRLIELHPEWKTTRRQRARVREFAKKYVDLHLHEEVVKFNRDLAFSGGQLYYLDKAIEIVHREAESDGKKDDWGLFRGRTDQVPSKN